MNVDYLFNKIILVYVPVTVHTKDGLWTRLIKLWHYYSTHILVCIPYLHEVNSVVWIIIVVHGWLEMGRD